MNRHLTLICALLALSGGSFAWWVDSHNDEPQAAVLVILIVTFSLGLFTPRKAWLWGLITGICLPAGYLFVNLFGNSGVNMPQPGWYAASLALIPAFIGAYIGSLARSILSSSMTK